MTEYYLTYHKFGETLVHELTLECSEREAEEIIEGLEAQGYKVCAIAG